MSIEYLNKNDTENFFDFIKKFWSKHHIYVTDKEYFKYEFSDHSNFVLYKKDDNIEAILGFLDYSKKGDVFLCMWKNSKTGIEGLQLFTFLLKSGFQSISTVGLNKTTAPVYKFFGMKVDKLKQYYILNPNIENFKIASVSKKPRKFDFTNRKDYKILYFNNMEELLGAVKYEEFEKYKPFKSKEYFNKRYFKNSYYEYKVIGLKGESFHSILVYRVFHANGSQCLRIIDFLGNEEEIKFYTKHLYEKMIAENMEYIDFYEYGLDDKNLIDAGFVMRKDHDENIIPNYFEPFEKRNIELYFSSTYDDLRVFKGDGDQDRPSLRK